MDYIISEQLVANIISKQTRACLHTDQWFQVLLPDGNCSICTKLNGLIIAI